MKLIIDNVSFSYNSVKTLDGISFSVESGKILSLLGPNGSGKSTLIKLIDAILTLRVGKIFVEGEDLNLKDPKERAKLFGYVPQRSDSFNITVFEAVLSGRRPHINFRVSKEDLRVVEDTLERIGLSHMKSRSILSLSGGEFQKVLIARALAQRPKILLLDEPLTYLDIKNQIEILELVDRFTRDLSLITIFVLHDINLAIRYSDFFLLLKEGRIYAYGGREIITGENVRSVFGVDVEIKELDGIPYIFVRNGSK